MVDAAAAGLGGLEVLVNCAGRYTPHAIDAVSYSEWQAQWRATLDVNLLGAANVTYCAVKHMKRGGRIVRVPPPAVPSGASPASRPTPPAKQASMPSANRWRLALGPRGIAVATVAPVVSSRPT